MICRLSRQRGIQPVIEHHYVRLDLSGQLIELMMNKTGPKERTPVLCVLWFLESSQ